MQYREMAKQSRHTGRSSGIGEHVRVQTEIWSLAVKRGVLKLTGKKMRWAGRVFDFFFCLVTAAMLVIGDTEMNPGPKLLVRLNVSWSL